MQNERRKKEARAGATRSTLHSALCTLHSALRRFCGDESGQGIIFAAATLLVLVGFVAFVFNIGRLLDRRTKMQIAADAAAYSGAMVEANSVSAIAWINSAMSQVYYNALKYAVDVNVAAVAAELDRRLNPDTYQSGQAYATYQTAWTQASNNLPQAKQWMVQLSQLENAIAILTPQLMEEEMFAVAGRAGGERMSVYPGFRMFPSGDRPPLRCSISCLGNGWRIINLNTGETLTVILNGNTWDMQWSKDGLETQEVKISQDSPTRWHIQYFQPPGTPAQEVFLENDGNLGWVVWGNAPGQNGGPPVPTPPITFTPVDMDNEGFNEGVRVSEGGYSQVLMRGADGNIYAWNSATNSYQLMTTSQTIVGGVNVQVNVTNTINFAGGASAQIGQPTTVNIGGTHIVLTNPPNISTGFGPLGIPGGIFITGFNPNQLNVSVGGFSLTPGNSNGRWSDHYNPWDELWWRNRLVVMGTVNGNPNQWQYDYEVLGALLNWDVSGSITKHAFMGSGNGYTSDSSTWPFWAYTANVADTTYEANHWFNVDPGQAGPRNDANQLAWDPTSPQAGPPPAGAYYQTATSGGSTVCISIGSLNNPNSVIRLMNPNPQSFPDENDYLDVRIFNQTSYYISAPPPPQMYPLVATEEFFKWGVNVGVWKHAYNGVINPNDTPMLFPSSREPAWGTVAIASARVGLYAPDQGGTAWQFGDADTRSNWCASSPYNLYYANVHAKLFASKNQVSDFDLDEDILQFAPPGAFAIDETGLSYLWSAILGPNSSWIDQFNGQSDPQVGNVLSNMLNRQGASFDYGSAQLNQVVEH
jgi:hypothetical protein